MTNPLKLDVTPHTYTVREISYVEWAAALVVYLTGRKA